MIQMQMLFEDVAEQKPDEEKPKRVSRSERMALLKAIGEKMATMDAKTKDDWCYFRCKCFDTSYFFALTSAQLAEFLDVLQWTKA